jgi:hypothetical protein
MSRPESPDFSSLARRVEPAVRFVPPRALRRVIRRAREAEGLEPVVVHDRAWWTKRGLLFSILTPAELGLSASDPDENLVLLPHPAAGGDLRHLWRDLFHLSLDRKIDEAFTAGRLGPADVQSLRDQLGPSQWHEIRVVLRDERLIDDSDPDRLVFREFLAFGYELLHFDPECSSIFFPGVHNFQATLEGAGGFLDAASLREQTRPDGVSDCPSFATPHPAPATAWPTATASDEFVRQAEEWSRNGNDLRAAIDLWRAGDARAQDFADRLAARLFQHLGSATSDEWRDAVRELLAAAADGGWPPERRLLYELQRACLTLERETFATDLVEWIRTFGRRPAGRRLTKPRWLDVARHLRRASHFADRRDAADHGHLHHLLSAAVHTAEGRARADLRPDLVAVLDEVGLVPTNLPERLSREKLVEELLDGACARGFLRIGDLRDAIARNRVKLPDLDGPGQFFGGDALLRANEKLTVRLDGVYRRGEIYMRLLQRGCSLFFATAIGRAFTLYLALPVIGAYVLIEGVHHMGEAGVGLWNWLSGWTATLNGFSVLAGGPAGTLATNPTLHHGGMNLYLLAGVSVFLFLMIHWAKFRRTVLRAAKFALLKVPRAIAHSPLVRSLLDNPATRFFRRHIALPLTIGGAGALVMWLTTFDRPSAVLVGCGLGLVSATLFRMPLGRRLEDRLNETAERAWRVVSVNFVLGLLTLILAFFQAILEVIDRAIYAVDEWLRFREGESKVTLGLKLGIGLVWFVFAYLFRFAWNLLVEPQINPIKHFPVVTVSHKMLLPLVPSLAKQFGTSPETMGLAVSGIPGVFGFLVWELKENWRLYKANAPRTIRPLPIGSHGEKMRALLRPGFHSGVIPKTFAKWRKAVRTGNHARAAKARHGIEHAAEALHRLAERDLVAYLHASTRWGNLPVAVGVPRLATNRVRLLVTVEGHPGEVIVSFEERGGWVIGSIEDPAWLSVLSSGQRAAFEDALLGLDKLAGTHALREQAARVLGPQAYQFDARPEGLLVPQSDGGTEFLDYDDGPELVAPQQRLPSADLVLSDRPVSWDGWVERWEADQAGKSPTDSLLPGWTVVPTAASR